MLKGFLYHCRLVLKSNRLNFLILLIITIGPHNWNRDQLFIGSVMAIFIVNLYLLLLPSVYESSDMQMLINSLPIRRLDLGRGRYAFHFLIALLLSCSIFIPLLAAEEYQLFPLPAKLQGLVLPTGIGFCCGLLLIDLLLLPFVMKLKHHLPLLLLVLLASVLLILLPVLILPLMLLARYPYGGLLVLVITFALLPVSCHYSRKNALKCKEE